MSESYEVVTAALTDHASGVAGLADELRGALDTAGHVTLADNAYGQTCQRIRSLLNAAAHAGGDSLQAGIDALESASVTLRANAAAYADVEAGGSNAFTGLSGQLE